jgi:hypothetical protein
MKKIYISMYICPAPTSLMNKNNLKNFKDAAQEKLLKDYNKTATSML